LQQPFRLSHFVFSVSGGCVNVGTAMDVDKETSGRVSIADLYVCVDLYASVRRSTTFLDLIDQFSVLSLPLFT
jgi:hypothetical protein